MKKIDGTGVNGKGQKRSFNSMLIGASTAQWRFLKGSNDISLQWDDSFHLPEYMMGPSFMTQNGLSFDSDATTVGSNDSDGLCTDDDVPMTVMPRLSHMHDPSQQRHQDQLLSLCKLKQRSRDKDMSMTRKLERKVFREMNQNYRFAGMEDDAYQHTLHRLIRKSDALEKRMRRDANELAHQLDMPQLLSRGSTRTIASDSDLESASSLPSERSVDVEGDVLRLRNFDDRDNQQQQHKSRYSTHLEHEISTPPVFMHAEQHSRQSKNSTPSLTKESSDYSIPIIEVDSGSQLSMGNPRAAHGSKDFVKSPRGTKRIISSVLLSGQGVTERIPDNNNDTEGRKSGWLNSRSNLAEPYSSLEIKASQEHHNVHQHYNSYRTDEDVASSPLTQSARGAIPLAASQRPFNERRGLQVSSPLSRQQFGTRDSHRSHASNTSSRLHIAERIQKELQEEEERTNRDPFGDIAEGLKDILQKRTLKLDPIPAYRSLHPDSMVRESRDIPAGLKVDSYSEEAQFVHYRIRLSNDVPQELLSATALDPPLHASASSTDASANNTAIAALPAASATAADDYMAPSRNRLLSRQRKLKTKHYGAYYLSPTEYSVMGELTTPVWQAPTISAATGEPCIALAGDAMQSRRINSAHTDGPHHPRSRQSRSADRRHVSSRTQDTPDEQRARRRETINCEMRLKGLTKLVQRLSTDASASSNQGAGPDSSSLAATNSSVSHSASLLPGALEQAVAALQERSANGPVAAIDAMMSSLNDSSSADPELRDIRRRAVENERKLEDLKCASRFKEYLLRTENYAPAWLQGVKVENSSTGNSNNSGNKQQQLSDMDHQIGSVIPSALRQNRAAAINT